MVDAGNDPAISNAPVSSGGSVVASAVVVPAREAELAFVTGGNVAMVNVKVGDRVTAGHILVELEDTLAQLEVERAQRTLRELMSPASLAAAEEALVTAQDAYDDAKRKVDNIDSRYTDAATLEYLQAQLLLAEDALDKAQESYDKVSGNSDTDPAKARATTNLYNAQKAYDTAFGNYNWYSDTPSENEIALANAELNSASAALQEAQWYLAELKDEAIPADASGMKLAQLQQARADFEAAQVRLEQTQLTAPISGVVAQVNVVAGEYATPGRVLIVLSQVDQLQVKTTDLSERDIVRIKIGDPAVILIDALGVEFNGKVTGISPLANTLGGDVVYEVTLDFDEQPAGALSGMTADVTIGK